MEKIGNNFISKVILKNIHEKIFNLCIFKVNNDILINYIT